MLLGQTRPSPQPDQRFGTWAAGPADDGVEVDGLAAFGADAAGPLRLWPRRFAGGRPGLDGSWPIRRALGEVVGAEVHGGGLGVGGAGIAGNRDDPAALGAFAGLRGVRGPHLQPLAARAGEPDEAVGVARAETSAAHPDRAEHLGQTPGRDPPSGRSDFWPQRQVARGMDRSLRWLKAGPVQTFNAAALEAFEGNHGVEAAGAEPFEVEGDELEA